MALSGATAQAAQMAQMQELMDSPRMKRMMKEQKRLQAQMYFRRLIAKRTVKRGRKRNKRTRL